MKTNKVKQIRVALYIRTSADEGIDIQKDELRKFCKANDYVWNDKYVYEDTGYSGTSEINDRPELKRLLRDVKKGEFDVVLVYRIDRLSRNPRILLNVVADLDRFGVAFKSVIEQLDSSTPFGRSTIHMIGTFAEMERNNH